MLVPRSNPAFVEGAISSLKRQEVFVALVSVPLAKVNVCVVFEAPLFTVRPVADMLTFPVVDRAANVVAPVTPRVVPTEMAPVVFKLVIVGVDDDMRFLLPSVRTNCEAVNPLILRAAKVGLFVVDSLWFSRGWKFPL